MKLLVLLGLVLVVACGGGSSTPSDSGIEGRVLVGPQCPVEVAGSPCPDRPASVRLVISKQNSHESVASVTSDADGRFRVALTPGAYTIIPLSQGPGPGAPQDVTVRRHAFTKVTVRIDSGIR